jgi:glucose-1-phosphate cytidylyltransferase
MPRYGSGYRTASVVGLTPLPTMSNLPSGNHRRYRLKVVVLAGGLGTRLAEETDVRPKPMVEIGERPILWHIIKHYEHFGFREFLVALGYKGEVIKRYFLDYYRLNGDMTINFARDTVETHTKEAIDWTVHLLDTGRDTNTGGRIKRLEPMLKNGTFMVSYGDGVSNVNLKSLLRFHRSHGRIATVTAVRPPARFGALTFDKDPALVSAFAEKSQTNEGWINGGFFVFEPMIFDYLEGDHSSLEAEAMTQLVTQGQLAAYRHDRFWQGMDTLREKRLLERLWRKGRAPWKVWE